MMEDGSKLPVKSINVTKNEHKRRIIEGAIEGMISGGLPQNNVKPMKAFLELIYEAGYNEGVRVAIERPFKLMKE